MENNQEPLSTGENLNELIAQCGGRDKALKALFAGLEANLTYWDVTAKRMVTVPDHKTRERCATRILEYAEGRPVERREVLTKTITSQEDVIAMAKASPAMKAALRELLAKVSGPPSLELGASSKKN